MMPRTRQLAAALLCVALIALLVLAASLSDLQLQAGSPFPGASGNGSPAGTTGAATGPSQSGSLPVVQAILGVLVLAFLVYVPARLSRLVSVRNIFRLVLGLFALIILLGLLPRIPPGSTAPPPGDTTAAGTPASYTYTVSPLGNPPGEFQWLATAGLLLAVALVVILLFRRASRPARPAGVIAVKAEEALAELKSGADFHDVIIRCYLQMSEVLQAEQNIERRQSMTPREFEDWLESEGIPAAPVRRLTTLFETVRYGNERPTRQDEAAGVDCLQQISQYCRAAVEKR